MQVLASINGTMRNWCWSNVSSKPRSVREYLFSTFTVGRRCFSEQFLQFMPSHSVCHDNHVAFSRLWASASYFNLFQLHFELEGDTVDRIPLPSPSSLTLSTPIPPSMVSPYALGIKWYHFISNDEVRRQTNQPLLTEIIQARRLTLFGHIGRMDDNVDGEQSLTSSPSVYWKRPPGRPRMTWMNRTTSTPMGCHGPTQSTWPRTDHSGGCWQPVRYALVVVQAGEEERRRRTPIQYRPTHSRVTIIAQNGISFSTEPQPNETWSWLPPKSNGLFHVPPFRWILCKSVQQILCNPANKQATNQQLSTLSSF